jgi:hypothetical protein
MGLRSYLCADDDVSLSDVLKLLVSMIFFIGLTSAYLYGGYRVMYLGTPCGGEQAAIWWFPCVMSELLFFVATVFLLAAVVLLCGATTIWAMGRVLAKCDSIIVIRRKKR